MNPAPQWTLWRQDDNGSSTIISPNLTKEAAESQMAELEARGHKQHYWIEPDQSNALPSLNLIVIRSNDIEAAKRFYELIGLTFTLHKHGSGTEHYACEMPNAVFEIYPQDTESSTGARLGFSVTSVDHTIEKLREQSHKIISAPKDTPWGRRAITIDTDGHCVEITSPLP